MEAVLAILVPNAAFLPAEAAPAADNPGPMPADPHFVTLAAFASAALALAACSPTFNWREVPVGDDGLVALLPCKPDRASRRLPLGSDSVPVDMAGCKAGGATFAIAHARAASAAQAGAWLLAWQAATRQQLGGAPWTEAAATLPRAAPEPAPARLATSAAATDRQAAHLQVLWFAEQRPGGWSIYQATILGAPSSAEASKTFFEGLRLP
jgi:hypothetical protein